MKKLAAILTGILLIGGVPHAASARPFDGGNNPFISNYLPSDNQNQRRQRILSLREIAQIIGQSVQGRIGDARLVKDNGRQVYIVRWESNGGQIIEFVVDAESGRILSRRGG